MSKNLTALEVLSISEKVAKAIKIKLPDKDMLLKTFNYKIPLPQMFQNDLYQMWVDRYYIAYSAFNEKTVHYAYITKSHITEEIRSYRAARVTQRNRVRLPRGIKQSFSAARKYMKLNEVDYFIAKKFEIG